MRVENCMHISVCIWTSQCGQKQHYKKGPQERTQNLDYVFKDQINYLSQAGFFLCLNMCIESEMRG